MQPVIVKLAFIGFIAAADVTTTPSTISPPPTTSAATASETGTSASSIDLASLWANINNITEPLPPYPPQDPWYCAKNNYTDYFVPPMPTGALYTNLVEYAGSIIAKTCTNKHTHPVCSDIGKKEWCDYTTVAPPQFSSQLSSLGSAAVSWSSVHSSGLEALPTQCPDSWHYYGGFYDGRDAWLNRSKIFAQCYEERYHSSKVLQPTSSSGAARKGYLN